jgi:hypothetical protein
VPGDFLLRVGVRSEISARAALRRLCDLRFYRDWLVEHGDGLGETIQRLLAGDGKSVGAAPDTVEPAVNVALQNRRGFGDAGHNAQFAQPHRSRRSERTDARTDGPRRLQRAMRARRGGQRISGSNWRALVDADIGRFKRVIGDALRSCTERRSATEVAVAVHMLNRMLEHGRPEYVRLA